VTSIDADQVMTRARQAQAGWAARTVTRRCTTIGRIRRELALHCEPFAELIARETAKPPLDALAGDVMVTLEAIRYFETHAPKILRPRRVSKPAFFFRGARFETNFEPHGVVLIFGPSNYPLQLSVIPMITALVAGNAVILKCSERAPETAALIARLCVHADLPHDLVQVLHDSPGDSAPLIDAQPDMIFFTGSSRNGQAVAERAATHLIPAVLELGGKDASIVFADCHLERAIEGIAYGAFSNSGRVCVGVKRVYVEAPIYEEFVGRLKLRVASLRVSFETDSDACPLSGHDANALRAQIEDALARGAILQFPQDRTALGCEPVLLSDVPHAARILTEESFGPTLCIAPFSDEAQAIALANASSFALGGSIWTRDYTRGRRVAARLSAGSCVVNDVIRVVANPYAPFGGNRLSGYGRYHGPEGLRAFSRIKTVMLASDRRPREVNWFPFTARTRRQLARLLRFRHAPAGFATRLIQLFMLFFLGLILSAPLPSQPTAKTHLKIDIQLGQQAHGELGYLIFDSASGFPGDRQKALRQGFIPISAGTQQAHIDIDMPPGTYAVSVYDDLNGNHKLDHNFLGIPREPVGVSNNPKARMGPPQFNDCSFQLGAAPQTITITLVRAS
jgi:4,4'-diapolycopenoate synthase